MNKLCENCSYRLSDCKGNKESTEAECGYYKKPTVLNAKKLAEENARIVNLFDQLIVELSELRNAAYDQGHVASGKAYKTAIGVVKKYKRSVRRAEE